MAKARDIDPSAPSEPAEPVVLSGYTVMARRYRPQDFTTLVGQDAISRALSNAIRSGRIAHAYLFTGPRGVGKTSTARILARCLNCEKGPTPEPCDACNICRAITLGNEVDVLEIDGASNRGIDSIRELRSTVGYHPMHCRFKIYIIDEVHMLTDQAFNALLKTLEEPPPHVKFIFATTDPQQLPATVLSRCQRFDFSAISLGVMKTLLADIVIREGRRAEPEALELICRQSAGSMRDAQSLLDQSLAYAENDLTIDVVHLLLGTGDEGLVCQIAQAVVDAKPAAVLLLLDGQAALGVSYKQLLIQLAAWWRDMMLIQVAGKDAPSLNTSPRYLEEVRGQSARLGMENTLVGLDLLDNALMRLKDSPHTRLLVEITLMRMARLGELLSVGQLSLALLESRKAQPAAPRPQLAGPADPGPDPKKAQAGDRADGPVAPAPHARVPQPVLAAPEPAAPPRVVPVPQVVATPARLRSVVEVWPQVIEGAGKMLAAGLYSASEPRVTGELTAVLRFPAKASRDHDFVQTRLARLTELVREITGQTWNLRLELEASSGAPPRQEELAPPIVGPDAPVAMNLVQLRAEIEKIPLINRAIELYHAEILSFDKDFGKPPPPPAEPPP